MTQSYESNLSLEQAAEKLRDAQRLVVTTHAKPDGDAFGSVIALTAALQRMGKQVDAFFMPPLPHSLQAMPGATLATMYHEGDVLPEADLYVVVDTGAWAQLQPIQAQLEPQLARTLILDHHLTGGAAAAWKYIDGQAAAACEIIAQVIDALAGHGPQTPDAATSDPLNDPTIANALFAGIASDTGWFRFSNTRPYTHELAARLQRLGVDHADLYRRLEQAERPEKILLVRRALDSLEMFADGQAALMVLRASDFAETGAQLEETERIIDMPQVVESVRVVALITESRNSRNEPVRVSFRSKPPRPAGAEDGAAGGDADKAEHDAVNVATLAARFGGGGHARAAGAKIHAPLEDVITQVATAITQSIA